MLRSAVAILCWIAATYLVAYLGARLLSAAPPPGSMFATGWPREQIVVADVSDLRECLVVLDGRTTIDAGPVLLTYSGGRLSIRPYPPEPPDAP